MARIPQVYLVGNQLTVYSSDISLMHSMINDSFIITFIKVTLLIFEELDGSWYPNIIRICLLI
jgi:hypothetical protein